MKKMLIVSMFCLLCASIAIAAEQPQGTETTKPKKFTNEDLYQAIQKPPSYEIVSKKNISIKALEKNLSSYTASEIKKTPWNKRMQYKAVVTPDLTKEQYTTLFNKMVSDITKSDTDIDEISIVVFDNINAIDDIYNVAWIQWCPSGGWAKVTSYIASLNDRTGYKTTIEWADRYR